MILNFPDFTDQPPPAIASTEARAKHSTILVEDLVYA